MIFTVKNLLLLGVLIIAVITDIRNNRIPNWLTFPAMIMGLGFNFISAGVSGLLFGIEGLLLGGVLFIILYALGGMGAGDVKLMSAVGSILGPQMALMAVLYTAIIGGIYALAVILFHPRAGTTRKKITGTVKSLIYFRSLQYNKPEVSDNPPKLCYGVAIALGTITAVVMSAI